MKRAIRQLIALAAVLAAIPAATAVAGPIDIIRDCVDDERLQGNYSDAQLQNALRTLRGDADEYSNCRSIIGAAIGGGPDGKGSRDGADGRGADLDGDGKITPAERRKWREQQERERERERRQIAAIGNGFGGIGGDYDGTGGDRASSSGGGMPLPLILALVALTLAAVGGGTWYAAQRNPAVANALRRVSSLVDRY
jgi:hypothetical protein